MTVRAMVAGGLVLLAMAVAVPVAGLASAPERSVASKLVEHLGVSDEDAQAIVARMEEAREAGEALRAEVKAQAQALKEARDAGDRKGMKQALAGLERLREDGLALREDLRDDIFDRLTVEQQATWALYHLHRKAKAHRALDQLRMWKLQETL